VCIEDLGVVFRKIALGFGDTSINNAICAASPKGDEQESSSQIVDIFGYFYKDVPSSEHAKITTKYSRLIL
jgi:hypothetical protein